MATHTNDHELYIYGGLPSATQQFKIIQQEGRPMYQVTEEPPQYQKDLKFVQENWIGGHGQYRFGQPDMYFEGQSIDTTVEGKIILGPLIYEVKESDDSNLDSAVVQFIKFEATGEWLCATAGKIYRYDVGSNGKWTAASTTVAGVTQMVEHNTIMYAAVGASSKWYYSTDGDTWTQTDLTNAYANHLFNSPNVSGTANVLWSSKNPNEIRSTTDGRTVAGGGSQLTSPAYIGDTSANINNILLVNNELMIGREDNLLNYTSDGGTYPAIRKEEIHDNTNNFKYTTRWQACTYFSLGNMMGEITGNNQYDIMGPLAKIDDIGKAGTIIGLAADTNWLYPAIDEGTNSIIYKGRERWVGNTLRWEFCPFVFLGTNACAAIGICEHSSTDRRLWFAYGNNTGYVILSDNPLANSAARYAANGWIRMSYTYGTNAYWDKLFQSVVTETKSCSSTVKVTPKYLKDTDTTASALTAAITTNGVVKTNNTAEKSCKRIQFELYLETGSSSSTPEVTYFEARGVEKPEAVRVHDVTYVLGDKPSERVSTLRTFFRTGRTATTLMKFADLRFGHTTGSGTDWVWVVMQPGYPKEVPIKHERGREPELGLQCRFQEVSYTVA